MKTYMILLATFLLVAQNSDIVFNPYLFDIDSTHAYQSMFPVPKVGF